jgi:cytochrome b561
MANKLPLPLFTFESAIEKIIAVKVSKSIQWADVAQDVWNVLKRGGLGSTVIVGQVMCPARLHQPLRKQRHNLAYFRGKPMNQVTKPYYDVLSRAFHWLTAIAVTIAFILGPGGFGRMMRQGVDPATHSDIVWHESLGILVFSLTVLRLVWVAFRPAAPKFSMAGWMHIASKLAHLVLWALLLALPITALLALASENHPLTLLGGIRFDQMPLIANSALAPLVDWGDVHKFLGDAIMWLAGLHAVAAIFHHVVLKDRVLAAMLPQVERR